PAIGLVGAWFEMTAALTTTGGTVYGSLAAVPDAVHLWRGMVGWAGGLMTLVAAYAILAPRRLGGFEIEASTLRGPGRENDQVVSLSATTPALASRLSRAARVIVPVYGLLTAGLAIIFNTLGQGGLESAVHAMSILSTSGISPVQGGLAAANSFSAEAVAALFLLITATPVLWSKASQTGLNVPWQRDPQLRMLLFLVGITTLALFARHWLGALTVDDSEPLSDAFTALWGNIFTTLSFLSTTGFESASWEASRNWSGLSNPGLFLLALATVGGGAATTAGGVKLIRAFALMRHGYREIERLAQPASIIGVGSDMRGIMRRGAAIAWTFVMLFFMAILFTVLALTATGMKFDTALIAATAALTNTGPAMAAVTVDGRTFADLTSPAQSILAMAMIAGRMEMLALIALIRLDTWRKDTTQVRNATIKHW
ncbi:MAG: potassium transporter TrkG, partial [Pseudomonadota bacterium]